MPQQPDYDALAKRFGGTPAETPDYDALAAGQQPSQQKLEGVPDITSVPGRMGRGLLRTILPSTEPSDYLEGPAFAAQHPWQSLDLLINAIKDAAVGQGRKAVEAVEATRNEPTTAGKLGKVTQAVGHGAAAVIPVLGPAAANSGERIGSGIEHGDVGEVAEGVGEGMGLVAPFVAPHGAGALKGTVTKVTEGLRTKVADAAARGVERRYVDVAAPKVGANKVRFGNDVAKVAPALAREEGMGAGSRTGLQGKVEGKLADAEGALDDAANNRLSARTFPTKPIIAALMEKRRRLTAESVQASAISYKQTSVGGKVATTKVKGMGPAGQDVVPAPNAARVAQIDQAIAEIKQLGPDARYEPLRRIREAYDGPAKAVYSPSVTADFLKANGNKMGAADVTGVLREHLANMDPATAAANADYSLYKKAADAMKAAEETERVRPNMFRKTMGRVAGASLGEASGGPMGAVGGVLAADFIDTIARSGVTTKIQTARLLATLEDALRGNRTTQVQSTVAKLNRIYTAVTKTSITMGRTQEAAR
jgi:hypothetical protein